MIFYKGENETDEIAASFSGNDVPEILVIESDHERFIKGSRFDYGFFRIATDEGYTIISLPMETTQ